MGKIVIWREREGVGEWRCPGGQLSRSPLGTLALPALLRASSVWVSGGSQVFVTIVLSPNAVIQSMQLATVHNCSVNPFILLVFPEASCSHYGA